MATKKIKIKVTVQASYVEYHKHLRGDYIHHLLNDY